jgi:hypothetical protein
VYSDSQEMLRSNCEEDLKRHDRNVFILNLTSDAFCIHCGNVLCGATDVTLLIYSNRLAVNDWLGCSGAGLLTVSVCVKFLGTLRRCNLLSMCMVLWGYDTTWLLSQYTYIYRVCL